MKIRLEWKPQDLWIGAFWKTVPGLNPEEEPVAEVHVWICLVPMLPLHLWWCRYPTREAEDCIRLDDCTLLWTPGKPLPLNPPRETGE